MSRTDISKHLVHFTKGDGPYDYRGAFSHLQSIMTDQVLRGNSNLIKGQYSCVCFSEAPLTSLADGLKNQSGYSRYTPFGVMFDKAWVFAHEGRPVIYEPKEEFELLPESHRWRHVRYEPTAAPPIDFTWEREWRIHAPELRFEPQEAVIVVLSHDWADQLVREHQGSLIRQYSTIMDENAAEYYGLSAFPWRIAILNE